jgi:endonuclease/exonuclease/phosphatase family metal-dependent hydrolase
MLFRSADRHPALVVGDFNDWRDTLAPQLTTFGFRQVTSPVSRFRTFPAWLAIGSLDKAFVRGPIDVRHARVVRTSLAKVASDHLPLVIDFHLHGNSRHRAEIPLADIRRLEVTRPSGPGAYS